MVQFRSKKLHGKFGRHTDDKKLGKSWHWLRNGNLNGKKKAAVSSTGASLKQQLN